MKLLLSWVLVLFVTVSNADIYKCRENGKLSYSRIACAKPDEFKLKNDISMAKIAEAQAKLQADLKVAAEKKQLAKEVKDKERILRAAENQSFAEHRKADAKHREADALEDRNRIEANKRRNSVYIYRAPLYY